MLYGVVKLRPYTVLHLLASHACCSYSTVLKIECESHPRASMTVTWHAFYSRIEVSSRHVFETVFVSIMECLIGPCFLRPAGYAWIQNSLWHFGWPFYIVTCKTRCCEVPFEEYCRFILEHGNGYTIKLVRNIGAGKKFVDNKLRARTFSANPHHWRGPYPVAGHWEYWTGFCQLVGSLLL